MNDSDLFALRKEEIREFSQVSDMREFLENLFVPSNFYFPMVIGYPDFNQSDWRVRNLSPLDVIDRLTVESYLEGLRAVEKQEALKTTTKGVLVYQGVDSMHSSNLDTLLLDVSARNKRSKDYPVFSLRVHLSKRYEGDKETLCYSAISKLSPTIFESCCSKFVGPNESYKPLLL